MFSANADKVPEYQDDDEMTHRTATARKNNSGGIIHAKSTETSYKRDSVCTMEYESKGWLAMRPDVSFDSQPGNSKDQFDKMKSWFVSEDPSAGISGPTEYGIPGEWPGEVASKDRSDFSGIAPGIPNSNLRRGFSSQEMRVSTDETDGLSQWANKKPGRSEDPELLQGNNGKFVEEVGTVLWQLIDQNEKLVSKLKGIKQSQEREAWNESEQQVDLDPAIQIAGASGLGNMESLKPEMEKVAQTLTESNKHLRKELSKTQKELEKNAALLWEQSYDIRDYQTKVEMLEAKLMNCVSIDDMGSFNLRAKTPTEAIQEEQLKTLGERNKNLNRMVKDLELEVEQLKVEMGHLFAGCYFCEADDFRTI